MVESEGAIEPGDVAAFELRERLVPPSAGRLGFVGRGWRWGMRIRDQRERSRPFTDGAP